MGENVYEGSTAESNQNPQPPNAPNAQTFPQVLPLTQNEKVMFDWLKSIDRESKSINEELKSINGKITLFYALAIIWLVLVAIYLVIIFINYMNSPMDFS
jgi:hypothetical protein